MVALDATVINIALPSAQHALHATDAERQWVVTVYTLAFGGCCSAVAWLAAGIVALVLLGAAISALVRAIRSRRAIVFTSVGLAAVLAAAIAGASFASNQSNGASLGMALATAVAMFCYLAAIFTLR